MRTDTHRPSAIDPTEYRYVSCVYHGEADWEGNAMARKQLQADMERTGGTFSQHEHGGTCHICGALALSRAYFHHQPTNRYIVTGLECADKLGGGDFRDFRRNLDDARKNLAGVKKAKALVEDNGGDWDAVRELFANRQPARICAVDYRGVSPDGRPWEQRYCQQIITAADIVRKLIAYGDLSPRQWSFLGELLGRIEAGPIVPPKSEVDAPVGKVEVIGEVVSVKLQAGYYDDVYKMLVKADEGWKVWVSVPKAISDVEPGERVRFTATLEQSKDDAGFAFGKRPTKAARVA